MRLLQDHDRFSKLASGIQSIVVILAVLIGGAWTAYTFSALKSSEKAQLEIEQAKLKVPVLDIDISSDVLAKRKPIANNKEDYYLHFTVKIHNTGNILTNLDLSKDSLFVTEIASMGSLIESNTSSSHRIFTANMGNLEMIAILPGNKIELNYMVPVYDPNFYLSEFRVPVQADQMTYVPGAKICDYIERPGPVECDMQRIEARYWFASTYVNFVPTKH